MSAAEKRTHEQGLVALLRQLHDDLDAAVCEAYGWPPDLSDEAILARLVASTPTGPPKRPAGWSAGSARPTRPRLMKVKNLFR